MLLAQVVAARIKQAACSEIALPEFREVVTTTIAAARGGR
jgi:hypothetical protein